MTNLVLPDPAPLAPPERARMSRLTLRKLRRARVTPGLILALTFLLLIAIMAIFAPLIAPFDPLRQNITHRLQKPSGSHWLGTDELGRDQLSRLIFGTRVIIAAIAITLGIGFLVGVPAGIAAGYRRGIVDGVLTRIFDGMMSVPSIIFAMTFIAVAGPGLTNAMIAVGIIYSPLYFRLARASTQVVNSEPFIEATRSIGCSPRRIVGRHVLPNVLPPLLVQVAAGASRAVAAEASLSFLGFGVRPPTASWGGMLTQGSQNIVSAPHLVYAPGSAIALTVLSLSVLTSWINRLIGRRQEVQL